MANILNRQDVDLFYELYANLLCFVNKQEKIIETALLHPDDFVNLTLEERKKIRGVLYERKSYIDEFLTSQDARGLSSEKRLIVSQWKCFEKGKFFIYKHLKKHSIFLNDSDKERAFAVSGISDPLKEMFPDPPILVEAVLLPFRERIIYDGLILGYPVYFGSGICREMSHRYQKAKYNFGLVSELPMDEVKEEEKGDFEKLKFYMKNKDNRDYYWDEIVELSEKNKELGDLYYREMGKVNALYFSKHLKKAGLKGKWFGIIENTVVASGVTKNQLQKNIAEVVPEGKVERVYMFKT